jgi:ParB family chromosome partitioning protein
MPSLSDIKKHASKKNFKKVDVRPWDEPNKIQKSGELVTLIDPKKVFKWKFKDRPSNELGDIDSLASEFKSIGQQQPSILRETKDGQFELIIGERRWLASKKAGIPLKAIIKKLSDSEAAIIQAAENEGREDLSDYAKGISFSRLIKSGVIKQKDLIDQLNKTKQQISALLSFDKIPEEVIEAIGEMKLISANTAERIKELCNKGEEYKQAIISIAPKLSTGKVGRHSLEKLVNNILLKINIKKSGNKKILSSDGRHIFTWRMDNNNLPSIHFPKNINNFILDGEIDMNKLSNKILSIFEQELLALKEKSVRTDKRK